MLRMYTIYMLNIYLIYIGEICCISSSPLIIYIDLLYCCCVIVCFLLGLCCLPEICLSIYWDGDGILLNVLYFLLSFNWGAQERPSSH